MQVLPDPNTCSGSTHSSADRATLRRSLKPSASTKSSPSKLVRLPARNARKRLTITVELLGGAEAWWRIQSRGVSWKAPGHLCLSDVLMRINAGQLWRDDVRI
jgi:hypothetical protein